MQKLVCYVFAPTVLAYRLWLLNEEEAAGQQRAHGAGAVHGSLRPDEFDAGVRKRQDGVQQDRSAR